MYSLIACTDERGGIGMHDGTIPFKNSADLANFKRRTVGAAVIMGRKTWESLKRPLPERINVVLTRNASVDALQGAHHVYGSVAECVMALHRLYPKLTKFVIGGAEIYEAFLAARCIDTMYITRAPGDYKCDIFLRYDQYSIASAEADEAEASLDPRWRASIFHMANREEEAYVELMDSIIKNGTPAPNRTETAARSLFGRMLEFDLQDNTLPLCTVRRSFSRGIFEELMWNLRGQTDSKILEAKGVNIWQGNTTREFLDSRGLHHLADGEIGPTYGHNWRRWGAQYAAGSSGVDQLAKAIHLIKNEPHSRRILVDLWNPAMTDQCALPPCAFLYQFNVRDTMLDCMMVQRSSDFALAGMWNVSYGAMLVHLMAAMTGTTPGRLVWCAGNVHIYENHMEAAKKMCGRQPRVFPKLFIKRVPADITQFEFDDLMIVGYRPHAAIKDGALDMVA